MLIFVVCYEYLVFVLLHYVFVVLVSRISL